MKPDAAEAVRLLRAGDGRRCLSLPHDRRCSCPPNHLNCGTAQDWMKNQIAIWSVAYDGRDLRDRTVHPAIGSVQLAERAIRHWTHEGELVLDPFCGVGSTGVAALDAGRGFVGIDLCGAYLDAARERLAQFVRGELPAVLIEDDARHARWWLEPGSVALVFTSPPYANILSRRQTNRSRRERRNWAYGRRLSYSDDARDLGNLEPDAYYDEIARIIDSLAPLLSERGRVVLDVPDLWDGTRRHSTAGALQTRLPRWNLRNIIIWDRRNLVNRPSIFGWPKTFIQLSTTYELLLEFEPVRSGARKRQSRRGRRGEPIQLDLLDGTRT